MADDPKPVVPADPADDAGHDKWTHRLVAGGLCLLALSCVSAITYLSGTGHVIPEILSTVSTAAVASLGTMLAAVMKSR